MAAAGGMAGKMTRAASVAPCGTLVSMSEDRSRGEELVPVQVRVQRALVERIDACARAEGIRCPEAIRAVARLWCEREEAAQARRRRLQAAEDR